MTTMVSVSSQLPNRDHSHDRIEPRRPRSEDILPFFHASIVTKASGRAVSTRLMPDPGDVYWVDSLLGADYLNFVLSTAMSEGGSTKQSRKRAQSLVAVVVREYRVWGERIPKRAAESMIRILTEAFRRVDRDAHLSWDGDELIAQWLHSPRSLTIFTDGAGDIRARFVNSVSKERASGYRAVSQLLASNVSSFSDHPELRSVYKSYLSSTCHYVAR